MVYFIQQGHNGPVKIGYCEAGRSVDDRLRSLQTGNPDLLSVITTIPGGGRACERYFHKAFASENIRGEWFNNSRLLREVMALIESSGGVGWEDLVPHRGDPATLPKPERKSAKRVAKKSKKVALQKQIADGSLKITYAEPG